jgi:hypothetical protein
MRYQFFIGCLPERFPGSEIINRFDEICFSLRIVPGYDVDAVYEPRGFTFVITKTVQEQFID